MMKITDVKIEVVRRTLPDTGLDSDLGRFFGDVEQGVLRILTDEGIEGNCFVGDFRGGGHGQFGPILNVLKPEIVGWDAFERERLWNRLPILSGRRGLNMNAWAPVDVALWDIAGKAAGVPVYKLLGANRDETEVYATYPPRHESPEGYFEEARQIFDAGFRAYKIHPGALATSDVLEMMAGVRDIAGDDRELMLDPNNGYDFRKALDVGSAADDLGFYWFEDPIPAHEYDNIAELSRRLMTPLCMSDKPENQFQTGYHYIRLNASRLVRGTARKARHNRAEEAVLDGRGIRHQLRDWNGGQLAAEHRQSACNLLGAELRVLRILDADGGASVRSGGGHRAERAAHARRANGSRIGVCA